MSTEQDKPGGAPHAPAHSFQPIAPAAADAGRAIEDAAADALPEPASGRNAAKPIPIWLWLPAALVALAVGYWVMATFN